MRFSTVFCKLICNFLLFSHIYICLRQKACIYNNILTSPTKFFKPFIASNIDKIQLLRVETNYMTARQKISRCGSEFPHRLFCIFLLYGTVKFFNQLFDLLARVFSVSVNVRIRDIRPFFRRLCAQLPFKRGQQYWRKRAFPVSAYTYRYAFVFNE